METIWIDNSVLYLKLETRQVRDENKMLLQGRANAHMRNGTIEFGDWETNVVVENYGDFFDPKPKSLWERIFG